MRGISRYRVRWARAAISCDLQHVASLCVQRRTESDAWSKRNKTSPSAVRCLVTACLFTLSCGRCLYSCLQPLPSRSWNGMTRACWTRQSPLPRSVLPLSCCTPVAASHRHRINAAVICVAGTVWAVERYCLPSACCRPGFILVYGMVGL